MKAYFDDDPNNRNDIDAPDESTASSASAASAGEEAAAQERAFWAARRRSAELDDDEAGRRERRELGRQARRMHLQVRVQRYRRGVDSGPVPGDLSLPPLPGRDPHLDDETGRDD
ncbi:hypothetical protein [Streptomyces sp. WM6378]|uniref:hypothetical protein n=1 Tax=Streptomyces sp. WM6378 TaxID=1415557 RepID=UPI000AF78E12|nr:hypothetical protein [Streptomyces sp. WM6378]